MQAIMLRIAADPRIQAVVTAVLSEITACGILGTYDKLLDHFAEKVAREIIKIEKQGVNNGGIQLLSESQHNTEPKS